MVSSSGGAAPQRADVVHVVEDDAEVRDFAAGVLRSVGIDCHAWETPQALPDAILMDVMMPGVDGITAIRRLREDASTAKIPIIAVTASGRPSERECCLEAGADDFLAKPFQAAELETMLARVLDDARRSRVR